MSPEAETITVPETTASAAAGNALGASRWGIGILLAGLIAWGGYSFPLMSWEVPDSMAHISAMSPPSEQEKLAAVEYSNLWKNTLLRFSVAGLALGLTGLFVCRGRNLAASVVALVSGPLAGAAAGSLSLLLRHYLDQQRSIPLIGEESRPLFCDILVFTVMTGILLLPLAILLRLQRSKSEQQKALSIPFAGLLTGLLVPVIGAVILSANTNSSVFPPTGLDITGLWFGSMICFTILMVVFMGGKPAKTEAVAE